ncbi:MAG: hypothetical protein JNJ85_15965, partial [Candidatus Kapabacteria bacterium]|nr:hypothetical protein [Candidatus Kapabacteria bacterium]
MSTAYQSEQSESTLYSTKFIHYIVFIAILAVATFLFQQFVAVKIVQGFVESQFKPEGGVVLTSFQGVKAVASPEGEKHASDDVKREYIKPDLIFDFTSKVREEKAHGYTKGANEWLVKHPKLGEEAIILEPYGFYVLSFDIGFVLAILITMMLPTSIGFISLKIEREIHNNKSKVRLQTGFTEEVVEMLTMPDSKLAENAEQDRKRVAELFRVVWTRTTPEDQHESFGTHQIILFDDVFDKNTDVVAFRNNGLYIRIREHFSDFVEGEIEDIKSAHAWQTNHFKIFAALRLYMAHHFTERYSNNVTGFAYGGAALLIIAVGIRGLKFIPAARPSLILFAILLEFSMLALLAFVLFYTEEEERMDKMLKKMEDASRSQ